MPGNDDVAARMIPNGPGAAAVLAAGIGSFTLAAIAMVADKAKSLANLLNVYHPTGPLSGVSSLAIVVWLVAWAVLRYFWSGRNVDLRRVIVVAVALLAAGVLLTFPPFADLL